MRREPERGETFMNEEQRALVFQCAHRLRSRLMFIMLCSHTLKLDLRDVLTRDNEQEFQQMDRILDEAKAVLSILIRQVELSPAADPKAERAQLMGSRVESEPVT
jgi:hypothetical protein